MAWTALAISALCGALFAVILKLFAKYGVDTLQGVFFNYITAAAVSLCIGGGVEGIGAVASSSWVWLAVIEGAGFVVGMLLLAACSTRVGVGLTNISSRASLVISVLFSYLIFHEQTPNWIAIFMVLVSMFLVFGCKSGTKGGRDVRNWLLPLTVFLCFGTTNFLLKALESLSGSASAHGGVMLFIFGTASLVCLISYFARGGFKKNPFQPKAVVGGIILGLDNVACTSLMLVALGRIEAVVFYPVYNVTIVLLSLIIGYAMFRERLTWIQFAGVILATVAIVLLVI